MDCLNEWDHFATKKDAQWLKSIGMGMVRATPEERAELMSHFVQLLLNNGIVNHPEVGWVMCAEVYANAMAINELTKFSTTLQRKV